MGRNTIHVPRKKSLLHTDAGEKRFYFVHSYFVACDDPEDAIALAHYGNAFVSGFQRKRLFGVQFHPEKSHRFGMELMRNFVELGVG
ncbi:hypothetical protein EKL30_11700 [Candidimonas sp. SYP-B2681]|uniref:glutamine amidotransferase-related protein n=1 Tax=Candidimonas sp. SYP-B2681 TaxID=2497686 RepID=UPI000F864BFB|nr:hypothetical protein EKL30_11700 [Candidimonas sp. SYP-B2681]